MTRLRHGKVGHEEDAMKEQKPLAVLLTPVLPLPTGSGRALRAWDWLQTLSKDYRVHVFALERAANCSGIGKDYPAEGVWISADGRVSATRRRKLAGLMFPFLAPWFPSLAADWLGLPPWDTKLRELEACLARESVKHIVVFRLYMHNLGLAVSSRFPDATMSLDLDDFESYTRFSVAGSLARMRRFREAVREFACAIQYRFIERYMIGPYRTAYLASKEDFHILTTRLAKEVTYRPNRITIPEDFPRASSARVLTLLFVGVLNYPPNEEAVHFMVERLLPELRKKLPRPWRLSIVGRGASAELSELMRGHEEVEFIDNADSLKEWYEAAHIVLVPLHAGGGTKFKALEGFAHRRPIVSTGHGMRGLGALADTHFLPAETVETFALAIKRLADDRALADRIADAGWQLCYDNYRIE